MTISTDRAAPQAAVDWTLAGAVPNSAVVVTWVTPAGTTVGVWSEETDGNGAAFGTLLVPAAPGGTGHEIRFTIGDVTLSAGFEVSPRISPNPTVATPGQTISIILRGFAARDSVTLSWQDASGTFVPVATALTSNSGSVTNLLVTVPDWATNGVNKLRVDGAIDQQSSALTISAPSVSIAPASGIVNSWVEYELSNYAPNSAVTITWQRTSGSTIDVGSTTTDGSGAASGAIRVPATPGGPGQVVTFSAGSVTRSATFSVTPRIKVTPEVVGRGETIDISLRGFGRQETVVVRWRANGAGPFQTIASGQTSNSGSANIDVTMPATAADGTWQVRIESASFNLQNGSVTVSGGDPFELSADGAPDLTVAAAILPAIAMRKITTRHKRRRAFRID